MRPLAVALTGGVGAGKSEALRMFEALGAATLSSDEIVHDLLHSDEAVRASLEDRFGPDVLTSAGEIDRAVLGRRVFTPSRGSLLPRVGASPARDSRAAALPR